MLADMAQVMEAPRMEAIHMVDTVITSMEDMLLDLMAELWYLRLAFSKKFISSRVN